MVKFLSPRGRGHLQSSSLFWVAEAQVFRVWPPELREVQIRSLVSEHLVRSGHTLIAPKCPQASRDQWRQIRRGRHHTSPRNSDLCQDIDS